MANNAINSLKFGSDTFIFTLPYASCSTAAATAAKTATVDQFSLETGARVVIKFTVTNTAANPTLNINSTGAKAIYYRGAAIAAGNLAANRTYEFVYNGTQWELIGDLDTNSTYTVNNGTITISAGTGLSGGGDFTTNQSSAETITLGLATSGVTAGTYGPSADVSGTNGTTIKVPEITVDSYGRVTSVTNRTYTSKDTGDITGVTAGNGLTGGGTSGGVTLNVGAGTGISVAADTVGLDHEYYATAEHSGLMSAADKSKLDGIAAGANNYTYTLPAATSSALGGVQLGYSASGANIPVQLSSNKAYVALTKSAVTTALGLTPTANTGDITGVTAGSGLTGGATSGTATLNVGAGSGITVSDDAVAVNTTYTTSGKNYAVAVDTTSGGLYVNVPWSNTDTHYTTGINAGGTGATANAATSNPYITIKDNSTHRGQIQLKGSGATSVSSDANGVITISSTDNNTTYSAATTSAAGLMSAADKTKLDGITASADTVSFTRSLTSGTKIGTITINGTGTDLYCQTNTNTTYSAGSGLSLSSTTFSVNTNYTSSGKNYKVAVDATSGGLYVNVPWTDNNTTYGVVSTSANGLAPKLPGGTTQYLRADGTWATPPDTNTTYSNMTAATSSAAGKAGLVPAPAAGKQSSFLRGDGTWATPTNTTYSNMTAATSSAAGKAGLVPAPAAGAQAKFLRGDGTWQTPTNTTYGTASRTADGLMASGYYAYLMDHTHSYAASDHTHTVSIAADSGTNQLTLAHGTKYKLTAGGKSFIFTMPSDSNTTYGVVSTSANGLAPKLPGGTAKYLRADGTWATPPDTNTTYSAATTSAAGLMSATDKAKLDGIAANANNYTYTLPAATSSALGGVKVGSNISVSSGTISLTKANVTAALGYTPPTSDTNTTYSAGTGISLSGTTFSLNSGYYATSTNSGLMSAADKAKLDGIAAGATALSLGTTATTAAKGNHTHSYLPLSGGNITGHIYLTGAAANSSTSNTSQIVFGTSSDNHVCISSNNNAIVINPTTSTTTNQIVLYLDQASSFPSGISGPLYGNASTASALTTTSKGSATNPVYFSGGVPVACTYSLGASVPSGAKFTDTTYSSGTGITISGTTINLNTGYYATTTQNGLMSASDKSKLDGIAAGATALSLGTTATTAAKGNHTHSSVSNAFTIAAPTSSTTPNYPFQIKYNSSLIFKVRQDGTTYADKAYYSTGADYAEYFEWLDGNSSNEDRRGLFVTVSDTGNGKIELAQNSNNVVGIVSANPSMVGNDAEMHWSKKYLTDVFGSYIMEEVVHPEAIGEDGQVIPEYTTYEPKLNPEYNPNLDYVPRSQRKEWAVIGLLGQLVVCDDGSCWAGGYCKCGPNGVATVSAESGWKVLARLDENHIRVLFK